MITYNHEKYILEAIEGVLMQECDFEVELILANDCSTDVTDLIIEDILKDHSRSSWIKYTKHDKNLGVMPNFIWALNQCQGKYIALCEGDDYWTDPLKLQKQVDFLEANPDYVIHSGAAVYLSDNLDLNEKLLYTDSQDKTFSLDDFLSSNKIITCTMMFRNIKFVLPDSFSKLTFGDWFLYIVLLKNTDLKAYRSVEIFSVYRKHASGVTSLLSDINYFNTHILQIITIHKYVGSKSFAAKDLQVLSNYFKDKYLLEIKKHLYLNATETFILRFKYCVFDALYYKYLSILKHQFIRN